MTHPQWPDSAFFEIFQASNGWSLHDYWLRSTFGFIDAQFEVRPWRILRRGQAELMNDRNAIIDACRGQAREDGESLDGYDRVIAFVHAPPCNAGAWTTPGDAALDQNGWLPYYQHEVGHMLGFEHSFGPRGVYDDAYCVMGATNVQSHAIVMPAAFNNLTILKGADFWRSERVLSAAALYRYVPDFASSPSVVGFLAERSDVTLTALTQGHWGGTLLAVVPTDSGEFTIEYRARFGDDEGIRPAVVVHSIGRRFFDAGHEVNPVWFEAAIDPVTGTTQVIDHDLQVQIASSDGREAGLYLTRLA
jgi:hypothetical protein